MNTEKYVEELIQQCIDTIDFAFPKNNFRERFVSAHPTMTDISLMVFAKYLNNLNKSMSDFVIKLASSRITQSRNQHRNTYHKVEDFNKVVAEYVFWQIIGTYARHPKTLDSSKGDQHWIAHCYLKEFTERSQSRRSRRSNSTLSFKEVTFKNGEAHINPISEKLFIYKVDRGLKKVLYPYYSEMFFSKVESDYAGFLNRMNREPAIVMDNWDRVIFHVFVSTYYLRVAPPYMCKGEVRKSWWRFRGDFNSRTMFSKLFEILDTSLAYSRVEIHKSSKPFILSPYDIPVIKKVTDSNYGEISSYVFPISQKVAVIFSDNPLKRVQKNRIIRSYRYNTVRRAVEKNLPLYCHSRQPVDLSL